MKILSDSIVKPIISEKSFAEAKQDKYTFVVAKNANKTDIKNAIEKMFGVNVIGVATANMKGKKVKFTKYGKSVTDLSYKKARVILKKGQKLDIFEEATGDKKDKK